MSTVGSDVGVLSNVANRPIPKGVVHSGDPVYGALRGRPMCPPNVVLDRVQRDKFERPLTAIRLTETRLGAEERPSRPKPLSTTHVNDIGAEMGHRHSPYQRSAGGIWSHATASSSRINKSTALTSVFQRVCPVQASPRIPGSPLSSVVIVTQFVTHPHTRRS